MRLNDLFKVTAIAGALTLAACGGDINITPTVNDNSVDNSQSNSNNVTETAAPVVADVACASYTDARGLNEGTKTGEDCVYSTSFASATVEIESNITLRALPNDGVHVFEGALQIGKDVTTDGTTVVVPTTNPTLTVEPGTTVTFTSGEAIVRIARGAKIQAVGTAAAPITFTSAKAYDRYDLANEGAKYADWGGIIINGQAITDQCDDAARAANTCNIQSEGIASNFGGSDNTDSSGAIKFTKIWYAGSGPRTGGSGDDLNSLTLNAVGNGTAIDYIHIHQGYDDGIEIFGGDVWFSHVVVTDTQDDSFDFDAGWQGGAQFLFVQHGTADGANMGNGGFEQDGKKSGGSAVTAADIANVTIKATGLPSVRDEDDSVPMKFDDEYTAEFYNVVITKAAADNACLNFSSDGQKKADLITLNNSVIACDTLSNPVTFGDTAPAALQGTAVADWLAATSEVVADETVGLLAANGINTDMTNITVTPETDLGSKDARFVDADYIGAVAADDASSAWYNWVVAAVAAANAD